MITSGKYLIIAIALLSLLTFPSSLHAFSCDVDGTNCACEWDNEELVSFSVQYAEDRPRFTMELPFAYFSRASRPVQGQKRRGALIHVNGKNFKPWPNNVRRHSRFGPLIRILVARPGTFERVVQSRIQLATKNRSNVKVDYEVLDAEYGLKRPDIKYHPKSVYKDEILLGHDENGKLTDFIVCKRVDDVPYPHCQHTIDADLELLKISYAREMLSQWQATARKTRALFACATKDNS